MKKIYLICFLFSAVLFSGCDSNIIIKEYTITIDDKVFVCKGTSIDIIQNWKNFTIKISYMNEPVFQKQGNEISFIAKVLEERSSETTRNDAGVTKTQKVITHEN